MSEMLFDLELATVDAGVNDGDALDLRPGDDAWVSCRHCQLLTTAAGVAGRGHGAGSVTCARYLAWDDGGA